MGSDVDWREWSEFAKTTDGTKSDEIGLVLTTSCADDWLYTELYLVGGLEHGFYLPIKWECHHPN